MARLVAKNVSNKNAGNGTISTTRVVRKAAESHVSLCWANPKLMEDLEMVTSSV
jgi:hypothetical protein